MEQKLYEMTVKIRCFILAILVVGISMSTFAQVSATANVTATLVTPIEISKEIDMNFGNVAVSSSAGTVVLTPSGSRSLTGGVTLPMVAGTVTAAVFYISGTPDYAYSITLPSADLTLSNGTDNMSVNVFASNPASTGILSASGLQELNVGATLNVGASQPNGVYTSVNPFDVTVNYN